MSNINAEKVKNAFMKRGVNLLQNQNNVIDEDDDESLVLSDEEVMTLGGYLLDARKAMNDALETINEALEMLGVDESDGSELMDGSLM